MQQGLNVRHLLIISLGYNEYLHEEIDKVYEKKRWDYYETFKKSGFYDDLVIKSFSTVREEQMRKVAGIVEWSYNHNDLTLIQHFINKGYKNVSRYYQQNKHRLDLQEFTLYMVKRGKSTQLYDYSELDLLMFHAVLLYIAHQDNYDINRLLNTPYGRMILKGLDGFILDLGHEISNKHKIAMEEKTNKEVVEYIQSTLGIDINKKFPGVIDNMFDFVIDNGVTEKLTAQGLTKETTTIDYISATRSKLFNEGIYKYIGAHSSTLKLSRLNYGDLLDVEISIDDLKMYAYNAIGRKKGNNLSDDDTQQFFIASLYIHAVISQYKKQKERLINDSTEAWYVDVKNREQQLNDKERFYEKMKTNLESTLTDEREKRKEADKKNVALEKEIENLRKELNSSKEEKGELVELRNFVYNQKKSNFVSNDISITEAAEALNKKKIVVCGGHQNMQRKLKEWVSELETMSTDTLGKSFNYLSKYDVIYFYPNYANHSFYKKIKAAIKHSTTKFVYLPDIDNVETIIFEMYDNIKNEEPSS